MKYNDISNASWNGKCWNPLTQKYEDCVKVSNIASNVGKGQPRCCIPSFCCIDCNFALRWAKCFKNLDAIFPPDTYTNDVLFGSLEELKQALIANGCYYSFNYEEPDRGIFDVILGNRLTCYDTFVLTDTDKLAPHSQCLIISDSRNQCSPFSICWFTEVVDFNGTLNQVSITNTLLCRAPFTLSVDNINYFVCDACNIRTIRGCEMKTRIVNPVTEIPFGTTEIEIEIELVVPDCCYASEATMYVSSPYFSILGGFVDLPTYPNNNVYNYNVSIAVDPLTPIGNYNVMVLLKNVCGDKIMYFNIEVV